jgi:multidrug efflux pump
LISKFFIDRPIFASVLSIVITLAGGVALLKLPLALYPPISPPTVTVDCSYPGASAQVVSETVAVPIEQQVNGVENMMYMSSQCTNDGSYNLTVTFKHGMDLNMAQVLVQNRISLALPNLPDVIKQTGVNIRKQSPDILLAVAINSPGDLGDLLWMPTVSDAKEIPKQGKNRVVVARINDVLHFRIFDGVGATVVDTDERRLPDQAFLIEDLKKQLGKLGRPAQPAALATNQIAASVALITGYVPPSRFDQLYLSNYTVIQLKDELARLPGISEVRVFGQRDYSMRIWLDPDQLAYRSMTATDVANALREQNVPVATGQLGQQPVKVGQVIQVPFDTIGRLKTVEQFENVIVKVGHESRIVRLKDVAKVTLGAKDEGLACKVNGKPSVSLAIFQLPDANALDTAIIVKQKMAEMAKRFPAGVAYEIRYDTTPFISESINEVFKTLREAVILVALVVLLFLQNWRSAIIPLIAVPVAIIGTFAVMAVMGFSLNNLTLFGLVLAIGIVVDDAIVVVEAVEHHIEHGMAPRAATIRAMEEVSGPVIAIGLVLSAVFVPCAFISGIIGQFFRQFALTIATSTIISAFNSLTLSPALAAMLLKPKREAEYNVLPKLAFAAAGGVLGYVYVLSKLLPLSTRALMSISSRFPDGPWWAACVVAIMGGCVAGWLLAGVCNWVLGSFFSGFNLIFRWSTAGYTRIVGGMLRISILVLIVYGGMVYFTYWNFNRTPNGFIPSQDMGYLLVNVQAPDSVSLERTLQIMDRLERIAKATPGVKHTQIVAGQSLLLSANGSNFGSMFVILDDFDKRREPKLYGEAIRQTLSSEFEKRVPEAMMTVLGPPPVRGVGRAGGFKIMIEDRGDNGSVQLQEQTESLVDVAKKAAPTGSAKAKSASAQVPAKESPPTLAAKKTEATQKRSGGDSPQTKAKGPDAFVGLTSVFRANVPSLFFDVDRSQAMAKEVPIREVFDTLRIYLGSLYVNDFNLYGRTWQVIVQADAKFRNQIEDVRRLRARNVDGAMVPVGTVATVKEVNGPLVLTRYNMYPAAPINGAAAPGVSSGDAIKTLEELADGELGPSMAYEWTELAYLEKQAGNTAMVIFGFAVVMVFLVLAAQYESWALPLAIILVVPTCLLSAIQGVRWANQDINIFTQIGFVVLVGLASKNAILIVEFAKHRREHGETSRQATLDACKLRLRPIIMTSMAFILGVLPLLVTTGAGAEMRRTLGTTVFSGMVGVTFFGIFLTPVFFFVIDRVTETALFSSPLVRWTGRIGIYALTLGIVPLLALLPKMIRAGRQPAPGKPEPIDPELGAAPAPALVEHE